MAYKYCEETTRSQPLYYNNLSCVIKLKDVVKREGGENISDISEVIDLDAVAQNKHPNQTPSTMDVAFCIAEPKKLGKQVEYKKTGQKTTVNGRWCLVELKYDVRSLQSLKKDDIEKKINGSKQLIGYDIPFYNKYYFVFSNKQLGRNILNRISGGNPQSPYIPLTTIELLQEFFD